MVKSFFNHFLFILTAALISLRPFFLESVFPRPFFYYEIILILLVVIRFTCDAKTRVWASHSLMKVWGAWFFLAFISLLFHHEGAFQRQHLGPPFGGGFFFFLTPSYSADRTARQWTMAALLVGSLVSLVWTSVQWNVD